MPCVNGTDLQRLSFITHEALRAFFSLPAVPNRFSTLRNTNAIALLQNILSITFDPPRKLRRFVNSKRVLPVVDPQMCQLHDCSPFPANVPNTSSSTFLLIYDPAPSRSERFSIRTQLNSSAGLTKKCVPNAPLHPYVPFVAALPPRTGSCRIFTPSPQTKPGSGSMCFKGASVRIS